MLFGIVGKIVALILTWIAVLPQDVQKQEQVYVPPVVTQIPYTPPVITVVPTVYIGDNLDAWIAASNWPTDLHHIVRRIVLCESSGIVGIASNPPHVGLMQANVNIWGRVPADALSELNQGYEIYLIQGFSAWSCY